jgi:predicted ATP-grasp superfamily ATP-dependent carboligase
MRGSGRPSGRGVRVLLSEGASTSAREAITALGLAGYHVEICDPDPRCLGRFSRFVRRFHRCPGLRTDPQGFLAFILDRVSSGGIDVLLPIHEQGYLFAKVRDRLSPLVAVALPSFESYRQAHSKVGFHRLLTELDIPQPETRLIADLRDLAGLDRFPVVLKAPVGTASRGTWLISSAAELDAARRELETAGPFDEPYLLQEVVRGPIEHAQAVFDRGRLIAAHAFRQVARGAGGGPAIKDSVDRPQVRSHLARIGERLAWHGALSVDYLIDERGDVPRYIDCNPRLVEPMSARLADLDLADLLVRVSLGEAIEPVPGSREGVRTHLAMQALFGCALRSGSRRDLGREIWRLLAGRGPYRGSREELTPARLDWPSALPLTAAAAWLVIDPGAAHDLPRRGWGAHLLSSSSKRWIDDASARSPEDL